MAAVDVRALGLEVGPAFAAAFGAFVPLQAQPFQAGEDLGQGLGLVAFLVGVLDAQDEGAAVMAGEQKIEQGRARAADVQVAGGRGGEADHGGDRCVGIGHNDHFYMNWAGSSMSNEVQDAICAHLKIPPILY